MPEISRIRERVKGKKAAIYMGGPAKALTLIKGFAELGMEVVIIGTQTGKKEDYEQISYSVRDGTVIVDDANPLELAELLIEQKADLMVAGVKERFIAYKLGIAFCDFNHDRVVEFEGFDGFCKLCTGSGCFNQQPGMECCKAADPETRSSRIRRKIKSN